MRPRYNFLILNSPCSDIVSNENEIMTKKSKYRKFTHSNSSVSCFAPSSVVSNACIVFVALSIFLTQSWPVVSSEAVTTSMYWGKLTVAKTGALEATAPTKKMQNTCTNDRNTSLTC